MMARRPGVKRSPLWRFPTGSSRTLGNGLRIDRFDLPGQRVVTMALVLEAALTAEPPDREGVATLAMRALDEGTLDHPGATLGDALEGCGAVTADAGAGLDGASLTIEAPATRLDEATPLMAEMVQQPSFAETDVTRLVQDRLLAIATGEASPSVVATKALYQLLADRHRLGRPAGGDAGTVACLTPGDLRDWYTAAARPDRARLIIAGDYPDSVDAIVDRAFTGWCPVDCPPLPPAAPPPSPPSSRRLVVVDRPDAAQVSLRIGTLIPTRTDADWPALQVANAVVGSMFGSRLNRLLREERGLTYGAGSGLVPTRDTAVFMAQAECRLEVAAEAARLALEVLDVASAPLTETEVADAIAFITGATPLRLSTAHAVATQAVSFALGGVGPDWFNHYMSTVRNITAEQATAAFARHIRPDAISVAVCGPAGALVPALETAGLVPDHT